VSTTERKPKRSEQVQVVREHEVDRTACLSALAYVLDLPIPQEQDAPAATHQEAA
jgi:hypothetical protein